MSFLSCIGKRSKKSKTIEKKTIDRRQSIRSGVLQEGTDDLAEIKKDICLNISNDSKKSCTSKQQKQKQLLETPSTDIEKQLQASLDALVAENKMCRTQLNQHEASITSYQDNIKRLETANIDLKARVALAETEAAKISIENQKLLQKIVGMEENQAMMSRAELHSMIAQLEEAELKSSSKSATELSGIRTNPAEISRKKAALTQEDKQLSWRLTKTEDRLSQSEDENKRLREDLKEMLDSNTELQQIIVSDDSPLCPPKHNELSSMNVGCRSCTRRVSVSTETESEDSNTDIQQPALYARLCKSEKEQKRLQQAYDTLEQSFKNLALRLEECEEDKRDNSSATFRINTEPNLVLSSLKDLENDQNELKTSTVKLERVCDQLNDRIDVLYNENVDMKTQNDSLISHNKESENEKKKLMKEIETLRNDLNHSKDENKQLADEIGKYTQQQQKRKDTGSKNDLTNIEQALSDMKLKYEEANRRLKELTTPKHVQQTKSLDLNLITPSSLAERFRKELYEQHWKQAFDKMTKKLKKDDKKTIHILGEICTEAYLFCKRASRNQIETVASALLSPTTNHYRSNQLTKRHSSVKSLQEQLPEELRRRLLHYRCNPSQDMFNTGVNDFLNQIDYDRTRFLRHVSERDLSEIITYVSTCFELAWCMTVQYPPMYLLFKVKHGFEIDNEKFDRYHSRGKRVDYVIWPAVLTEEAGTCIQKGVVYPLPERA